MLVTVLLNIESFQRRPSIHASIFRGEKVELISTFWLNQSKCELLIRRNYFASWKSPLHGNMITTLRGLIFAWIKFRDFANFLAFREN